MSPNLKFHTPANPQTCTEQTHESNGMFLDEPWRPRPLLSKFLPFATVLRNPWQGLTLTCSGPDSVAAMHMHLSIPQRRVTGSVFGDHRSFQSPKELAVHFSLRFVQPGATQLLCDLKMSNSGSTRKKEAYQLPLKSEQRKNFRSKERTTFIFSLHAQCTQCFAGFPVSPTFLRAKF